MWITETPWPPIVVLGGVAVACLMAARSRQQGKFLAGAALCIVLAVAVWFIERAVVTDAERLEQRIFGLADAFHRNAADEMLGYFSPDALLLRQIALRGLEMVDIAPDYRITDLRIDVDDGGATALTQFRANATATLSAAGMVGYQPTRWEVDWIKQGDEWLITTVTRLSVIGDDEMGILDQHQ